MRQEPGCLSDPVFLDVFPVTGLSITGDPDVCLGETVQYSLNPVLTGLDVAWTLNPGTAGVFSANQQSGSAGVQWQQAELLAVHWRLTVLVVASVMGLSRTA